MKNTAYPRSLQESRVFIQYKSNAIRALWLERSSGRQNQRLEAGQEAQQARFLDGLGEVFTRSQAEG